MGSPSTRLIDEPVQIEAPVEREAGGVASAYLESTKPRITFLVVVTAAAGFCPGSKAGVFFARLLCLAGASALLSSGVGRLSQYIERDLDGLVFRTRMRPLPAG